MGQKRITRFSPRNSLLQASIALNLYFLLIGGQRNCFESLAQYIVATSYESDLAPTHVVGNKCGQENQNSTRHSLRAFASRRRLFLNPADVSDLDRYAAAWWMTRERFIQVNLSTIASLEGASFVPMEQLSEESDVVRQTRDWLDFSVEHLSTWQRMIQWHDDTSGYVENKCREYVYRRKDKLVDLHMTSTLAVIPFACPDGTPESLQNVLVGYLAATISSLVQHAAKRVVVVGYFEVDVKLVATAFDMLLSTDIARENGKSSRDYLTSRDYVLQRTELSFVWTANVNTTYEAFNVPFGTLNDLQKEFLKKPDDGVLVPGRGSFLGESNTASDFTFVYFTEFDQILHARLSSAFLEEMQDGGVIVPHRLQPLPHAQELTFISDLYGWHPYILGDKDHAPTISLHHSLETDACCDTTEHYGELTCESFWWMCGYDTGNFSYFDRFDFMRLVGGGSGIVTLAGSEHGRMCRVQLNGRGQC